MTTWKLPGLAVALMGSALFLSACGDDDDNTTGPGSSEAAFVRVAHLSPDAGNVDVWVDGAVVLSDVPYKAISPYLAVTPGDRRVQVTAAGAADPAGAVIDATIPVAMNTYSTVAATGPAASIGAIVLEDDLTPTAGSAEIRFVHAAADVDPVDITLTDGTVLFDAVAYQGAGTGLAVGAGSYDLQVRPDATDDTVVLSFGDVPVSAGTNYTVYAIGLAGDGSLDAIVSVDAAGTAATPIVDLEPATAEVRVAHFVPGAPNVDVWVDGAQELSNVPYEAVSGYLSLGAKTVEVLVVETGTTTPAIIDAALTLLPGSASTVAATGTTSDIQPLVLADRRAAAGSSEADVRFVHLAPLVDPVDVAVASGGPTLFSDVAFRQAEAYLSVAGATYDLEVRFATGGALALAVPGVPLAANTTYTVFAIGGDAGEPVMAKLVEDSAAGL